jgi:hypothetical protein
MDFRLTLCFSHPIGQARQEEKIESFAAPARAVMDAVGRDSSSWLRADDGRILFYTWHPDGLLDRLGTNPWLVRRKPDLVSGIAEAYDQLADAIGVEAAWMYSMHYPDGKGAYINEVIEQFPAIKGWVSNCEEVGQWDYIAKHAQERGTAYSQDVYGDFYDGMPKYASSGDGIHLHEELEAVTVDEIVRDVHILDLSQNFRAQLERAVEREADLINVASREVVQVLNVFCFTPLYELFETIIVGLKRGVCDFVTAVVKVHFFRGAWIDGFEVIRHGILHEA